MSQPSRDKELTSAGMGKHFTSPKKKRDKKKTTTFVHLPAQEIKRKFLLAKFNALKVASAPEEPTPDSVESHWQDDELVVMNSPDPVPVPESGGLKTTRRILPDTEAVRLYRSWGKLLPSLLDPFLAYTHASIAHIITPAGDLKSHCTAQTCTSKYAQIQCLYFDRKSKNT